jgi:hypothetical protein
MDDLKLEDAVTAFSEEHGWMPVPHYGEEK